MRTTLVLFALCVVAAALTSFGALPPHLRPTFHVKPTVTTTSDSATITCQTTEPVALRVRYWLRPHQVYTITEAVAATEHQVILGGLEAGTRYSCQILHEGGVSAVYQFRTEPRLVAFHVEPSLLFPFTRTPAFAVVQPIAFHVEPYLQLPTPDGMTIMWETTAPLPSEVEFGATPALGSVLRDPRPVRLHQVRIAHLEPGTRYYYRVRSAELVSGLNSFRTAPPPGTTKWRLAVYGDSRSNPAIHRKVVEQIARHDVDLILHTGDIVLDGRNYELWRREFFAPLAPIAGRVPWLTTIGNHERDSVNYFSYAALPDNAMGPSAGSRPLINNLAGHYYGLDFANAHIIGLDSNDWLLKDGRDRQQLQWLETHLKQPRAATWTFVAFHHPLFSAHRDRAINRLRWDWAPLFLDPANRIDGVLAGHDHFYARNYPLARLSDGPQRGVLFLTTAGGGAPLYPVKQRDYVATAQSVHHFTLFEFDGDEVTLSAIDITGRIIDHQVLTKESTPPEDLCIFEIEELREFLRKALATAVPIEVGGDQPTAIDSVLEVPTRFTTPVAGVLRWKEPSGWKLRSREIPFALQPREPLRIPLKAVVEPKGLGATPQLVIEFDAGRFRNRFVELSPFKLTNSGRVAVGRIQGVRVDGQLTEEGWRGARPIELLPPPGAALPALDQAWLASDGQQLYIATRLLDPARKVRVPASAGKDSSRLVLSGEHVRVELTDGQHTHLFALSAEQIPFHMLDGKESNCSWSAAAAGGDACWTAELAIPLHLFPNPQNLRLNIVHRGDQNREYELRPTFGRGDNPDVIPHWKSVTAREQFAALRWE